MSISLDDNQQNIVSAKRKATRPKYYNKATGKLTEISLDFEAFLILQGRQRNQDTVNWLDQCTDFSTRDLDRDSLAATAIKNEIEDAQKAQQELLPLINLFERFKASYNLTGFENIAEAGALLNDIQKAMDEVLNLTDRLNHRVIYGKQSLKLLKTNGMTSNDEKELNSWYASLTAY